VGTREDAARVRLAEAEQFCRDLNPWLSYVRGADPARFPALLVDETNVFINAPLALIATEVAAQLRLLGRLKDAGLLREASR
jgi:hypothetical protein